MSTALQLKKFKFLKRECAEHTGCQKKRGEKKKHFRTSIVPSDVGWNRCQQNKYNEYKQRQEKEQWAKKGLYSVLCKVCMALRYQKVKKHLGSSSAIHISLRDYQLKLLLFLRVTKILEIQSWKLPSHAYKLLIHIV